MGKKKSGYKIARLSNLVQLFTPRRASVQAPLLIISAPPEGGNVDPAIVGCNVLGPLKLVPKRVHGLRAGPRESLHWDTANEGEK